MRSDSGWFVKAALLLLASLMLTSCLGGSAVEAQGAPRVEVGKTYSVLVGAAAVRFKVLDVGSGGSVKVQAVEDAEGIGIEQGSTWWLNLNQALLIEAAR